LCDHCTSTKPKKDECKNYGSNASSHSYLLFEFGEKSRRDHVQTNLADCVIVGAPMNLRMSDVPG
jgi:hypothetical protein